MKVHLATQVPELRASDPADEALASAAKGGVVGAEEVSSPTGGLPCGVEALQQALALTKAKLADQHAKAADLQDLLAAKEVGSCCRVAAKRAGRAAGFLATG
jgi:hypothetical protein